MTWRTIKLGEVVTHRKGTIIIENDNEYKLCRVQLHRKGVVLRSNTLGLNIKTKKQQVCKSGDFLVAEMDAKVGGYGFVPEELDGAIVSSHYFLFELNKEKISPEYLEMISQLLILQDQIKAVGSTNYAAIRPINVLNWEIPICSIEKQASIVSKYINQRQQSEGLNSELTHQLTIVKQLRQSFLREAMQGKLTADFRSAHPELIEGENSAQALLEKIKAEKKQLIKDGKLKKEKEFTSVVADEMPFEIPESWVYHRLGTLIYYTDNLDLQKQLSPSMLINYVDIDSIDNERYKIRELKVKRVDELSSRARRILRNGFIIYSTVRPYLKNIAIIEDEVPNMIGSTGFNVFKPIVIESKFIFYFLLNPVLNNEFEKIMIGFNSPSITNTQFELTPIPLPPLSEQQAIVCKLDELMRSCDELEVSIRTSQKQNEMLLREVLREALDVEKKNFNYL